MLLRQGRSPSMVLLMTRCIYLETVVNEHALIRAYSPMTAPTHHGSSTQNPSCMPHPEVHMDYVRILFLHRIGSQGLSDSSLPRWKTDSRESRFKSMEISGKSPTLFLQWTCKRIDHLVPIARRGSRWHEPKIRLPIHHLLPSRFLEMACPFQSTKPYRISKVKISTATKHGEETLS